MLERAASKVAHFPAFAHPLPLPTQVPLVDESKYGGGLYVQAEADVASRRLVGLQRGEVLRLHTGQL